MSDWQEESDRERWPVRYPLKAPPRQAGGRSKECAPPRWTRSDNGDTNEVLKRLVWLLLAVEIGLALVAACVLPLLFLSPSVREGGVLGAIVSQVGRGLGISEQAVSLVVALACLLVFISMGLSLGLYHWLRRVCRG